MFLPYLVKYRVAHKKCPKLCNDLVLLNNRIQTKGNNIFKEQSQLNNMRNYDVIHFCFDSEICKNTFGYWVSKEYKIPVTNNFNMFNCMRSISSHNKKWKMCWIAPPFCFLTAFTRFSVVQWIFELSQWWLPSICFWLPLSGPVDLQTEVVALRTPNPAGYPKCSNLKD